MVSAIIAVNSSDVDLDTDIEGTSGLVGLTSSLGLISKLGELNWVMTSVVLFNPVSADADSSLDTDMVSAIITVKSSDVVLDTDIEGTSGLIGLTSSLGLISKLAELN